MEGKLHDVSFVSVALSVSEAEGDLGSETPREKEENTI